MYIQPAPAKVASSKNKKNILTLANPNMYELNTAEYLFMQHATQKLQNSK